MKKLIKKTIDQLTKVPEIRMPDRSATLTPEEHQRVWMIIRFGWAREETDLVLRYQLNLLAEWFNNPTGTNISPRVRTDIQLFLIKKLQLVDETRISYRYISAIFNLISEEG